MLLSLFHNAGIVRYPLLICSIIACAIILERAWTLAMLRKLEDQTFEGLKAALAQGRHEALSSREIAGEPVAQLLHALSRVLGVMAAFQGMSKSGLNGDAMASGIAEALSATAFGLLVAVPSIVVYNYLVGRVGMMLLQIQAHVALLGPLYLRAQSRETQEVR